MIRSNMAFNEIQKGIIYELNYYASGQSPYYVAQIILTINIQLSLKEFHRAWDVLLNQHRSLFSLTLPPHSDASTYPLVSSLTLPLGYQDISSFNRIKQETTLTHFAQSDRNESFNLTQAPLMRLNIFKLNEQRYQIIWAKHHLLMDGMGSYLTLKKVFTIYYELLNGQIKAYQTADLPLWNNRKEDVSHEGIKFWKKALSGYEQLGTVFAPIDRSARTQHYQINRYHFTIDFPLFDKMKRYVSDHHITMNTFLQGILGIILSIYSSCQNVVLGSVRRFPHRESYGIGLFTNTLPIVLTVDPKQQLDDYFNQVMTYGQAIRRYAHTPLRYLRQWAHLSMEQPLFETILDYKPFALDEALNQSFPLWQCHSSFYLNIPYPFVIEAVHRNKQLAITACYDSHHFDLPYVKRIAQTYMRILTLVTEGHVSQLADIPTLDKKLYQTIIKDWNKTPPLLSKRQPFHHYIEYFSEKQSHRPALHYGNSSLSYGQLNQLANQVAHYLKTLGVGTETKVALSFFPCFEQYITLLAILKCGATLIPLDPTYPSGRVKTILYEAKARFCITTEKIYVELISQALPEQKIKVICLENERSKWQQQPTNNLAVNIPLNTPAYIVFTSGTTGRPKGVIIEHAQWIEMVLSSIAHLGVSSKTRILQISGFGFDVFQCEWGMAFLSGGTLCLFQNHPFCPENVLSALRRYQITLIICASSILASLPFVSLPHLEVIAIGGEPCAAEILNFWSKNRALYTVYGITETTICSTIGKHLAKQKEVSIGRPMAGVNIYILNEQKRPCPPYVPGEIYIGGQGVARGYLNNHLETHMHFIVLRLNGHTERVYKTGDIARWLHSGDIEYLGRKDSQVKIRGNRVELTEIEQTITRIDGIKMACVMVISNHNNDYLVAYISVNKPCITAAILKKHLSTLLPSYMVPQHLFFLDTFPKGNNGKIDKQLLKKQAIELIKEALEDWEEDLDHQDSNAQILSGIKQSIRNILKIKRVPENHNFFDLGFDSISLASLPLAIKKHCQMDIEMIDLFAHSTTRALAEFIENKKKISEIK